MEREVQEGVGEGRGGDGLTGVGEVGQGGA